MTLKHVTIVFTFLLCNSCIVKSLHPFYTKKSIESQDAILGKWEADDKSVWRIISMKNIIEKEKKDSTESTSNELPKSYNHYNKGYLVLYTEDEKEDSEEDLFMAMPFKIKDDFFIDFLPIDAPLETKSPLENHLLNTHSVAKLEITSTNRIKLKWLSKDRIGELYRNNKIKLKRVVVGFDDNDNYVLTASSKELYSFLKKYNASDIKNKWGADIGFSLKKTGSHNDLIKEL